LKESRRIVRSDHVLIAETRHGFVCANAGVDSFKRSWRDIVTLLPATPTSPREISLPHSASEQASDSPSSSATPLAALGVSG